MDTSLSRKAVEDEYSNSEYVEGQLEADGEKNEKIARLFYSAVDEYHRANYGDSTSPNYGRLVDIGCGTGKLTEELAKHFSRTLGVDTSELQIAKAKEVVNNSNIEFVVGWGEHIPVDDASVDVISGMNVEKFLDMEKFITECHRVLKPTGIVVFCGSFFSDAAPENESLRSDTNILEQSSKLWEEARLKLRQYGKEISHPRWHSLQWCEELYQDIKGISKVRETTTFELKMSIAKFRDFLYCSPFYKQATGDPVDKFCNKLKKLWKMETETDEDVQVFFTMKAYTITLMKE